MKEKYIEERFPRYFKFGIRNDGRVDVASSLNDTICTVLERQARTLIKDRDEIVTTLVALAQKLDELDHEEFSKIWY